MKIIFLDVDGVLSNERTDYIYFDKDCVSVLNQIVEKSGGKAVVKVVVSSAWRVGHTVEGLNKIFNNGGFYFWGDDMTIADEYKLPKILEIEQKAKKYPFLDVDIIGKTDTGEGGRGKQILDDEIYDIIDVFPETCYEVNSNTGLIESDIEKCVEILNRTNNAKD